MSFKPKTYSYSRLTTYDKCSQYYKLVYVDNVGDVKQDSVPLRLGSYCHTSLEQFYEDETGAIASPYHALTKEGGVWDAELKKSGLLQIKSDLQRYAGHIMKIYQRAHPDYKGKDAIRTKEGRVTSAPLMTTPGREYAKMYGLENLSSRIDKVAGEAAPNWAMVSLSDVYAQTHAIMSQYTNPKEIDSVVAIEFPISNVLYQAADAEGNKLPGVSTTRPRGEYPLWVNEKGEHVVLDIEHKFFMPVLGSDGAIQKDADGNPVWSNTSLFHGFIDMIARDSKGRLLIIDHKTSAEQPTESKVARHEQLLAYGFAVYHMTGEMPYMIGINHLRSNKLVTAKFNLESAERAIARLAAIQKGIELGVFIKRDPDGFDTPCVRKDTRTATGLTICPGMQYCHPEWYAEYKAKHSDEIFI